jgi:hypothetical protein
VLVSGWLAVLGLPLEYLVNRYSSRARGWFVMLTETTHCGCVLCGAV